MEFRILGPLEVVRDDGEPVPLGSPKQRTLLALLLIHVNQVLSTDRIIDCIWGAQPPASGVSTLRFHVSKLRTALQTDDLVTERPGYGLRIDPQAIDAVQFQRLADEGRDALPGDPIRAAELLREALGLWRGEALVDVAYESFAQLSVTRLTELRMAVRLDRIEADIAAGGAADVIGEVEGLVGDQPLNERLHGLLMTALYRSGRQADALRAFQEARRLLGEELGIEPSPELRELEEQILLHDLPAAGPPPARPREPAPPQLPASAEEVHNLPAQLSSFVGRADDLARLRSLVNEGRCLSLVGPGGSGKTRLAIQVAAELVGRFPHGIWLVRLDQVDDRDAVATLAAAVLGVRQVPGISVEENLAKWAHGRRLLLLLDNCEHVLGPAAALARRFLESGPSVQVVATSREPLHLPGETVYRVAPLSVPAVEAAPANVLASDAGRLFVERAQEARPDFALRAGNSRAVSRICRTLDGLPLAIELAAARVSSLSAAEISRHLDDRFRLLADPGATTPPRHRTLQASLQWSVDLLTPAEQALFADLAVFRGGATLEAIETVCRAGEDRDVAAAVAGLVDKSLTVAERDGEATRYTTLDTMRAFAMEHMGDPASRAAAQERHAQYFAAFAEGAERELRGPDEAAWMQRLDAEEPNLRAAIEWSLANDRAELATRALGSLKLYLVARDHLSADARRWLEGAVAAGSDALDLTVKGLSTAGALAWAAGDSDAAEALQRRALEHARSGADPWRVFTALNDLGLVALDRGDRGEAADCFVESFGIAQQGGDEERIAYASALLANVEPPPRQRRLLEESLTTRRRLGRVSGVAHVASMLGWEAFASGRLEEAAGCFDDSAERWDEVGNRGGQALALCGRADVAALRGKAPDGRLERAMALGLAEKWHQAVALAEYRLGAAALAAGDVDGAAQRLDPGRPTWDGASLPVVARLAGLRAETLVTDGDLDAAEEQALQSVADWEKAARPDGVAWAQAILALIRSEAGQPGAAVELYRSAIGLADQAGTEPAVLDALLAPEVNSPAVLIDAVADIGVNLVALGQPERGAQLIAAARTTRQTAGIRTRPWHAERAAAAEVAAGLVLDEQSRDAVQGTAEAMPWEEVVALATG